MAINIFPMLLMPISQATAWYLVMMYNDDAEEQIFAATFYSSICYIAFFYCLWALYNRYLGGVDQELGHFTMGILSIATFVQSYIGSVVGTVLVLFNFLFVSYFFLFKWWKFEELANNVKNDTSSLGITWAVICKAYFVSNISLWSIVLYKFYIHKTVLSNL